MRLEDDAAFVEAKARVRDLPLPVPVMSYLFPHDLRLVGPEVDEARARAFFDRVVEVMAVGGTKLVVVATVAAQRMLARTTRGRGSMSRTSCGGSRAKPRALR